MREMDEQVATLRRDHAICGVAHLVQAAVLSGLVAQNIDDGAPKWPLDQLGWQETVSTHYYHLGILVPLFPALSSFNHLWSAFQPARIEDVLTSKTNAIRVAEYSLSASLMAWIIATLSGVTDLRSLVSIMVCNVGMQFVGYLVEKRKAQGADVTELIQLTLVGWALFLAQWLPILISFHTVIVSSDTKAPAIVWSIIWVMFALFCAFGVNQLVYILNSKWSHYGYERSYIWLSLVTKSILSWMVFGGVLSAKARFEKPQ